MKCAMLGWSYAKGMPHNSNEWAVIGIMPIVHVPLPPQNGAWECGYLVIEYFSQYLDKCGDKEHYPSVEVSPETCYRHFLTTILKLFWHYIILSHGSTFGTRT
jgi:hypothetical protein